MVPKYNRYRHTHHSVLRYLHGIVSYNIYRYAVGTYLYIIRFTFMNIYSVYVCLTVRKLYTNIYIYIVYILHIVNNVYSYI